jgi:hypothetical protein
MRVLILRVAEFLLANQFPSSENVNLVRPDCSDVVEAKNAKNKIKKNK